MDSSYDGDFSDINDETLEKIGLAEKLQHLSIGQFSEPSFPAHGIVHGPNSRCVVPLTFQRADIPDAPIINVWCVVVTGTPHTYLSFKTMEALVGKGNVNEELNYPFAIQDKNSRVDCQVSRAGSGFEKTNILGTMAIRALKLSLAFNWRGRSFTLHRN